MSNSRSVREGHVPVQPRADAGDRTPSTLEVPGAAPATGGLGRYDHVTRLPNRVPFLEDVARAMQGDGGNQTLLLVTLAEAKHFNEILRALGHAFAEDFIRAGAKRIAESLGTGRQIFHVSVLSFAVLINRDHGEPHRQTAQELARVFETPLIVQQIPIRSQLGIGMVDLSPEFGTPAEALRAALTAAQDSRATHEPFAYYNPQTDAAHQRAFRILTDLPAALAAEDQLKLVYQPRVDLTDHTCVSAEALIRWHHPELGWISPGEFIALAETTALIAPLTTFVLRAALHQLRRWQDAGIPLKVSVNVSPRNLSEPDFLERLVSWIREFEVDPTRLELEFTEGAVSPDNAMTARHLTSVRDLGMTVAIDDFGSGYSNMSYLTKIPADVVKIDKAFILNLDQSAQDQFLVRKIANLANGLGFTVVGEGIESAESYRFLGDIGCREGQGFYMSKPLPTAQLEDWLKAWR